MGSTFFTDRQWDWRKQFIDQTGPAFAGALIISPVVLSSDLVVGCALSGLMCGVVREVEQYMKADSLHLFDRVLDASLFAAGAAAIGWFWG